MHPLNQTHDTMHMLTGFGIDDAIHDPISGQILQQETMTTKLSLFIKPTS